MSEHRRTVPGLARFGACEPVCAAASTGGARSCAALERALAAIAADPACELASLSVLAIRDGHVVYEGQFGRRTIGNGAHADLPANRDTLYRIASISKLMTTLGLMRLVEDGTVALDADVSGIRQILQRATLARMFARQWTANGRGGNGDTAQGLFNCWGLGNAQFPDQPGRRLVEGGFDAVGHLGDAYGMRSVFAADLQRRNGIIVLAGGSASDPKLQQGRYSALARFEERIVGSLFRHAIGAEHLFLQAGEGGR